MLVLSCPVRIVQYASEVNSGLDSYVFTGDIYAHTGWIVY